MSFPICIGNPYKPLDNLLLKAKNARPTKNKKEEERKQKRKKENSFAQRESVVYYFTSEDKYQWQFHLLFYMVLLAIIRARSYHLKRTTDGKHFARNLVNFLT